jgi:Ser/Thr protein kinase RdoA (MazF antagonist)
MNTFTTLRRQQQVQRLRQLAKVALTHYPIAPMTITLVQYRNNAVFRVTTSSGEQFVLRIHAATNFTGTAPTYSVAEIESEVRWLTALHSNTDLLVPEPVPTHTGAWVPTVAVDAVPEARACVLFRWLPGRFRRAAPQPKTYTRVGHVMAALHRHAQQFGCPAGFVRPTLDWETMFGPTSTFGSVAESPLLTPREGALFHTLMAELRAGMAQVGRDANTFGLIHADIHPGNYLVVGNHVGIIDFEDCGFSYFLFDLAQPMLIVAQLPHAAALQAALLDGYSRVRPLPAQIDQLLPIFLAARLLLLIKLYAVSPNPQVHQEARQWVPGAVDTARNLLAS